MALQGERHMSDLPDGSDVADRAAAHDHPFVLIDEVRPPPRIQLARERLLMSRLYVELIRSLNDDYGSDFTGHSDSCTDRTIGIYVFLKTIMCTPARATMIAQTLKLPRTTVNRRLQELIKRGYVERVGNAYRVTDRVNIPDLKGKLERRIDLIIETAAELSKLRTAKVSSR
jgi:DNA-binding MarR family transcriptional regulator